MLILNRVHTKVLKKVLSHANVGHKSVDETLLSLFFLWIFCEPRFFFLSSFLSFKSRSKIVPGLKTGIINHWYFHRKTRETKIGPNLCDMRTVSDVQFVSICVLVLLSGNPPFRLFTWEQAKWDSCRSGFLLVFQTYLNTQVNLKFKCKQEIFQIRAKWKVLWGRLQRRFIWRHFHSHCRFIP